MEKGDTDVERMARGAGSRSGIMGFETDGIKKLDGP